VEILEKSVKVYLKDMKYENLSDIFEYCSEELVLYGYEGSTTQEYAEKNGLKFADIEKMGLFSRLDELVNGDKKYISWLDNEKVTYQVYSIFETSPSDIEYMQRDTNGKKEISLVTPTDDSEKNW